MTARARRGGPALVDELDSDSGDFGLVLERRDPLADSPVGNGVILPHAGVDLQQAARIADDERADAVF
jgi:hypothetical protein